MECDRAHPDGGDQQRRHPIDPSSPDDDAPDEKTDAGSGVDRLSPPSVEDLLAIDRGPRNHRGGQAVPAMKFKRRRQASADSLENSSYLRSKKEWGAPG